MPPKWTDPRATLKNIIIKHVSLSPIPITGSKVFGQLRKRTISSIEEDDIQQEDIQLDDVQKVSDEDNGHPPFHSHEDFSVDQKEDECDDDDVHSRSPPIRSIRRKIIGRASSSQSFFFCIFFFTRSSLIKTSSTVLLQFIYQILLFLGIRFQGIYVNCFQLANIYLHIISV